MRILERNYDVSIDKIKGAEKLAQDKVADIDKCSLNRYIVLLDESRYTINEDGCPEMTKAAQEEYDAFVTKIRESFLTKDIRVFDEGYGIDDDELDWHISGYLMFSKDDDDIAGIMEIDTCVRTEEEQGDDHATDNR